MTSAGAGAPHTHPAGALPMAVRLPEEMIKELDGMMERLNKGDVDERQAVITRLMDYEKQGKIPVEVLLEMADEENVTPAMYAISALGRSKHPAADRKS